MGAHILFGRIKVQSHASSEKDPCLPIPWRTPLGSGGRHGIGIVQRYIGPGLTPSMLAWGAIAFHARFHLLRIAGRMTSRQFITNVLAAKLLPFLQTIPGAVFQQDNARPYITPDVQHVLYAHHVTRLPWPADSPDLSPIKNVL